MKRLGAVIGAALILLALGYESSGRQLVTGRLTTTNGSPVVGCTVNRDLRLGFWFSGGFDSQGYLTGNDGKFRLPLGRGLNRLGFECPDGGSAAKTTVVWRHFTSNVSATYTP